jgi:hypothetical protein
MKGNSDGKNEKFWFWKWKHLVAKLLHVFKMAELPEIDLEVIKVFVHELLI